MKERNYHQLNSTPLSFQKIAFFFGVFRDRVLFGDHIRVGTAQPDNLNITLSWYQREKIVYARNASRLPDRQTEIRVKSNKLTFSGGLVAYFIILVLGTDM